ncbi:MAG: hypothetical protein ACTSQJ_01755 [Promethearchaeota archaeon]
MGRKLKFNEQSKILTIRVPESKYNEIKSLVNNFLENNDNNEYRIQNNNIEYLDFLMNFFQMNKNVLFSQNKAFFRENQEKFNQIVEIITGGK